jgi:hypothetical protein
MIQSIVQIEHENEITHLLVTNQNIEIGDYIFCDNKIKKIESTDDNFFGLKIIGSSKFIKKEIPLISTTGFVSFK